MKYEFREINYNEYLEKEMNNAPKQYREVKESHPDRIILLRMGDFYETYCEDAQTIHEVLGVTITNRIGDNSYRLAGFPYHALNTYLPKLIRAGKCVGICDVLEKPKPKTRITEKVNN